MRLFFYCSRPDSSTGYDLDHPSGADRLPVNKPQPSLDWPEHQWQGSARNRHSLALSARAGSGSGSCRSGSLYHPTGWSWMGVRKGGGRAQTRNRSVCFQIDGLSYGRLLGRFLLRAVIVQLNGGQVGTAQYRVRDLLRHHDDGGVQVTRHDLGQDRGVDHSQGLEPVD